ncbi:hypothetical protein KW790_01100 [Candidatus Parcubacteria bacterium]|nr:hypothetical protein [Candidatus Parcubacteria bacterium]
MATQLHKLREKSDRKSEARAADLPQSANWRDIGKALVDEQDRSSWEKERLLQEEDEYWTEMYRLDFERECLYDPDEGSADDHYDSVEANVRYEVSLYDLCDD